MYSRTGHKEVRDAKKGRPHYLIPSLPLMLSCCGKRSFLVGRLSEKTRLQKRQGQGQKK
ncbi:hypothetical protein IF2G_06998 [Cordyceps javanica]|nr:hypothetical protein IF2G_06998 [Cordyceps javanica]